MKLEDDQRFLNRIASARQSLRAAKGTRLDDLQDRPDSLRPRTVREGKTPYLAKQKKKLHPKY
ncbi:MAG TPA: hypothetical protein VLZ30_10015 [Verrucomicrobiae bacterium]|nr:hypothetical protein [Verrucomicrobiae bacterium]